MEFSDWLYNQYFKWRGDSRKSINQYASYLGISQPTLSAWFNRTRLTPSNYTLIVAIAHKHPEIYRILGLPLPYSEEIQQVAEIWDYLAESDKDRILEIALKPKDLVEAHILP